MEDHRGADLRSAKLRAFYARHVTARGGALDARVEAAFAAVPREPFAGPGPWSIPVGGPWRRRADGPLYLRTPDDDPAFLYQDVLIALDTERGIHIGEPSLHARCLDALAPKPGETVIQVGAGSGYYTALLAHLVGTTGRVHAFEIDRSLAERAARNLAPWPQAAVAGRSGAADALPEADAIYVNAGLPRPARTWLDALRPEGRLLFPLQPGGGWGGILLVRRSGTAEAWPARFVTRAAFIACRAESDGRDGQGLAEAFTRRVGDGARDPVRRAARWELLVRRRGLVALHPRAGGRNGRVTAPQRARATQKSTAPRSAALTGPAGKTSRAVRASAP